MQMHALQSSKFVSGIKPGDRIDVRDCEGDWFEAIILSVDRTIAKCHFINYSSKWDCNLQLSSDNVARRNTHSKSTGKADNYKYLLECVHELLYIRKEDDSYVRAAKEIDISSDELAQFIHRGEPKNDLQKTKILQWIQTQSNLMALDLNVLEIEENTDSDTIIAVNNGITIHGNPTALTLNSLPQYNAMTVTAPVNNNSNMHSVRGGIHLQPLNRRLMNVQMNNVMTHNVHRSINGLQLYGGNVTTAIPAPPADILASCIATLPKIMLAANDHAANTSNNLVQSKKNKSDTTSVTPNNADSGSLLVNPLHMISADVSGSTVSSLSSSTSSTLSSTSLTTSLYSSPNNINISERAHLAGAKRMRPQHEDILPAAKKRKLINLAADDEDSDYSSSSYESEDISDEVSISESDADDEDALDSDAVMVPKTDGTKLTFVTMSHKEFEREQKEFEKQAEIAKREILQKEKKQAMEEEKMRIQQKEEASKKHRMDIKRSTIKADDNDADAQKQKRKYKTRTKTDINAHELDDFSEFKIVLSDANLNLNHSVYPGRKFRGIAKSGRRWRARTCVLGKTQYGEKSFYNPFLAAMEYDRLIRANRQPELSGAVKTKTQIILNFPYGLKQQTIRIHKLFEKELQQTDQDAIKKRFNDRHKSRKKEKRVLLDDSEDEEYTRGKKRKKRKKKKRKRKKEKIKEEPIIDNKGLATKIPIEFLMKINSSLYQTERLKPFGPCCVEEDHAPIITHYKRKKRMQHEASKKGAVAQNIDEWIDSGSGGYSATSLFFGYRTLHIAPNK